MNKTEEKQQIYYDIEQIVYKLEDMLIKESRMDDSDKIDFMHESIHSLLDKLDQLENLCGYR